MTNETDPRLPLQDSTIPYDNFSRGLYQTEISELGDPTYQGKVRDSWIVKHDGDIQRVLVTTDRQSAYDRIVGTVPGKGQVLNSLSAFWFEQTQDIIPNHVIAVPHPNVTIAKQAVETLPVEVIVRGFMAKSSTSTSVYHNYIDQGRKEIYGIEFPEGLKANEEFPMGPIVTPTSKAEQGSHDEELTDTQASDIVDDSYGDGTWQQVRETALALYTRARDYSESHGLLLVDTKYEFGFNSAGELMLIDEIHTPDSSRYWLSKTYAERFAAGNNPESFDKEILRRWLAEQGFKGEGPIPPIDNVVIDRMAEAYTVPYRMLTGQDLPVANQSIAESVRPYLPQKGTIFVE
jgi:phosphoribosylaminoimidazole-succinocarboxamide synthase